MVRAHVGPHQGGIIVSFSYFMKSVVYILFSPSLNRYYIGFTQEPIQTRLHLHNTSGYGKSRYTSTVDDWQVFYVIECICKNQGINIERHIKRMKSKVYIQNLKKYPEIQEKLKSRYPCT